MTVALDNAAQMPPEAALRLLKRPGLSRDQRASCCSYLAGGFFQRPISWQRWRVIGPRIRIELKARAQAAGISTERALQLEIAAAIILAVAEVPDGPDLLSEVRACVQNTVTESLLGDWRHPFERLSEVPEQSIDESDQVSDGRLLERLPAIARLSPSERAAIERSSLGHEASGAERATLFRARAKLRKSVSKNNFCSCVTKCACQWNRGRPKAKGRVMDAVKNIEELLKKGTRHGSSGGARQTIPVSRRDLETVLLALRGPAAVMDGLGDGVIRVERPAVMIETSAELTREVRETATEVQAAILAGLIDPGSSIAMAACETLSVLDECGGIISLPYLQYLSCLLELDDEQTELADA